MLLFGLVLLVPTTVFAVDYGAKAGSNLIFNFEQRRRDQPPLIEMRDESMGLYTHRKPTTTMSPVVVPDSQNQMHNGRNEFSYQYNPVPLHPMPSPVPVSHTTTDHIQYAPWPSPPPAPEWTDLAQTFHKQGFPRYQKPVEHNTPIVPEFIQPPRFTTPLPLPQEMPSRPQYVQPQPTAPVQTNHPTIDFTRRPTAPIPPTAAPVSSPRNHFGKARQPVRGNHKFNWDDLVTEPSWKTQSTTTTTTPRAPAAKGPGPHTIPTLTPWTDGF